MKRPGEGAKAVKDAYQRPASIHRTASILR